MIGMFELCIMIALGIAALVEFIFLVYYFLKTPLRAFAHVKPHQMVVLHFTEDGKAIFRKADVESGMSVDRKRGLAFLLTPHATALEPKSRTKLGIAYDGYGVILPVEIHSAANELSDVGVDSYDQREELAEKARKSKRFRHFWLHKLLCLDKVYNFLKYNIRADIIEARIQRRTAAEVARMRKPLGLDAKTWIMIIIGAILGVYLIQTIFGGGASQAEAIGRAVGEALKPYLQQAAKNATQVVGTTIR